MFAFTIPLVIVHLPFGFGSTGPSAPSSAARDLLRPGGDLGLPLVRQNPAYTVKRFQRGNVWWFEVPSIWRFPLDYYVGIGLSIALAALAALAASDGAPLRGASLLLAGAFVLTGLAVPRALVPPWYGACARPTIATRRRLGRRREGGLEQRRPELHPLDSRTCWSGWLYPPIRGSWHRKARAASEARHLPHGSSVRGCGVRRLPTRPAGDPTIGRWSRRPRLIEWIANPLRDPAFEPSETTRR